MLRSMTAFARREQNTALGILSWEIRSVNHRFAEISLRLPEELRGLEATVRERIAAYVKRGKVDATFRFKPGDESGQALAINPDMAAAVLQACDTIEQQMGNPARISALDVLRWPNVLQAPSVDMEQLQQDMLSVLDEAVRELFTARQREGAELAKLLIQRNDAMRVQVAAVRERVPQVMAAQHDKLAARLNELKADLSNEVNEARLAQEMVILAQKIDINEELDRLSVHIDELPRILELDEPVGRRLDFLMQEFNREANTLSSKSIDSQVTHAAVDMKVLIEQMREQIQNIE